MMPLKRLSPDRNGRADGCLRRKSSAWPITKSVMLWSPPTLCTLTPSGRSASFHAAALRWVTRFSFRLVISFSRAARNSLIGWGAARWKGRRGNRFRRGDHRRENDLEHATALARQMVGLYGMSESIGLAHVGQKPNPFLPANQDGTIDARLQRENAREIDQEVKKLSFDAYETAKSILSSHRDELERVAQELLKCETLDEQSFNSLLGRRTRSP